MVGKSTLQTAAGTRGLQLSTGLPDDFCPTQGNPLRLTSPSPSRLGSSVNKQGSSFSNRFFLLFTGLPPGSAGCSLSTNHSCRRLHPPPPDGSAQVKVGRLCTPIAGGVDTARARAGLKPARLGRCCGGGIDLNSPATRCSVAESGIITGGLEFVRNVPGWIKSVCGRDVAGLSIWEAHGCGAGDVHVNGALELLKKRRQIASLENSLFV